MRQLTSRPSRWELEYDPRLVVDHSPFISSFSEEKKKKMRLRLFSGLLASKSAFSLNYVDFLEQNPSSRSHCSVTNITSSRLIGDVEQPTSASEHISPALRQYSGRPFMLEEPPKPKYILTF